MDFDEEDDDEEKVKKTTFPLTMFISEGYKYSRIGRFKAALSSFNAALQQEPNNLKTLLGRSECYMRQGMYPEAKEDAEAALGVNPKCSTAKTLKADAEYFLGDFEKSFITYRRARDSHPNCGTARLGHQECRRAIDNALRPDRAIVLDEEDVAELMMDGDVEERSAFKKKKLSRAPYADDIECLEHMLSDDIYRSVHQECRVLLEYMEKRRGFWMYHQPSTRRPWKKGPPLEGEVRKRKKGGSVGGKGGKRGNGKLEKEEPFNDEMEFEKLNLEVEEVYPINEEMEFEKLNLEVEEAYPINEEIEFEKLNLEVDEVENGELDVQKVGNENLEKEEAIDEELQNESLVKEKMENGELENEKVEIAESENGQLEEKKKMESEKEKQEENEVENEKLEEKPGTEKSENEKAVKDD